MRTSCDSCHKDASTFHYIQDVDQWVCGHCYTAPPARYTPGLKHSWEDGKGSIGVGHLEDIKRRRVAPDGSVYRDFGRKYI